MTDELQFRELLLKVQDCLSTEDRIRLHFLFADVLPRQLSDDPSINGTLNLLESLMNRGKISEQDFGYLITVFEKIGRLDIAQRLRAHTRNKPQPMNDDSNLLKRMLDDCDNDHVLPTNIEKRTRRKTLPNCQKLVQIGFTSFLTILIGILITLLVLKTIQKIKPKSSNIYQDPYSEKPDRVVLGYFTSWSIYERQFFISNVPVDKLTHISYACAKIDVDGTITYGDSTADTQQKFLGDEPNQYPQGNFNQLIKLKKKYPNIRTLITIGGYTNSYNFSNVASDATLRSAFAASCVEFIKQYQFDGIDIDWEYPVMYGAEYTKHRPDDKENYVLLLQELRRQLNQTEHYYLLTIRGGVQEHINNLDLPEMIPYLDWINVLTYDYTGYWKRETDHHSPLYRNPIIPHDNYEASSNCNATIKAYLDAGVPPEKLVMGLALYGRGWKVQSSRNNGYRQKTSSEALKGTWDDVGTFEYDVLKKYYVPKMKNYFDKDAYVPYLYDSSTGIWISYENNKSIDRKVQYINDKDLRGAFLYDLSCDRDADLINIVYEGIIRGVRIIS